MGMFTKAIEEIRHSSLTSKGTAGTIGLIGGVGAAAAIYNESTYEHSTGLSIATAGLTGLTLGVLAGTVGREGLILSAKDASGRTKLARGYSEFKEGLKSSDNYDWKLGTKDAMVGGAVVAGGVAGYAMGGDTSSTIRGSLIGAAAGLHGVTYKGLRERSTGLGIAGAAVTGSLGMATVGAMAGFAEGEGNTLSYAATFGAIGLSGLPFMHRVANNGSMIQSTIYASVGGKVGGLAGMLYGFAGSDKNGEHRTFDWGKAAAGGAIGGKIGASAGLLPARFRKVGSAEMF